MRKLVFLILLFASPLHAVTRYVGKSGSDSNSCATSQTEGTPKLTITSGLSCMSPGDTLIVKAGTYVEALTMPTSGTAGNLITLQAASGESVIIKPTASGVSGITLSSKDYIKIDGFEIDGTNVSGASGDGIKLDSSTSSVFSDHNTIQNCDIHHWDNQGITMARWSTDNLVTATTGTMKIHDIGDGSPTGNQDHGIYNRGSRNIVEKTEIYNISFGVAYQIYISGVNTEATDNIFRRNSVHNVSQRCITINSSLNTLVYNNLIYSCTGGGISNRHQAPSGDKFYNNTIYGNGAEAILIDTNASNAVVRNNIVYNNSSQITNSGTNTTFSNNFCGSAGTGCMSSPSGNPQFVNAGSADFHLLAASSAIGQGTSLSATFTDDYEGTFRPQGANWDVGAYEYFPPPASITITAPNGGENWQVGTSQSITWDSAGAGANVDIEFDRDGNGTYEEMIADDTANDGSFSWTVTAGNTTVGRWRVKDSGAATNDISDAAMTISGSNPGTITITYPTSGLYFYAGQTIPFSWTSSGVSGNVNIYESFNNGTYYQPTPIVASSPFNQDATWDATGPGGTQIKFKVCSVNDPNVCGESAAVTIAGTYVRVK